MKCVEKIVKNYLISLNGDRWQLDFSQWSFGKMWLKHFLYPSWVPFSSILPSPVMSTTLNVIVNISMHTIYVLLLFNRTTMFCCSGAKLCLTPCDPMDCSTPGFPVLHSLPEFAKTHVHWVDDAIQPSHPLSLTAPPAFNLSQHQGLFQWVSSSHQVAKVLELQLQHQSFQWIFRVISFRIDWFDLPVQGTLKSLLHHHNLKASILQHPAFFMVQLSQPYDYWKIIALIIWTIVGKVMSLLFNTWSRFVIAFLPRSKRLLILWLQSLSAVILGTKKIKSVTVSTFSPSICHEVMRPDAMILAFWILSFKPGFSVYTYP